MSPIIELVCTGSELLNGRSVNTHAQLIAQRLAPLGLRLERETTVPDDPAAIAECVGDAGIRADVVLISGGLGPTEDDCTADAIACLLNRGLREDADTVARLNARYAGSTGTFTGSRRRQARVVEGAAVLSNPVGTAPGERLETERGVFFLLPGPPGELAAVLEAHVLPWLSTRYPDDAVDEHILMVAGLGESDVADRIDAAGLSWGDLRLGFCAWPGRIEVRITRPAGSRGQGQILSDAVARLLGDAVYARCREELEVTVGRLLTEKGLTLAVAESCTGGLLSARLTDRPGSSRYFKGGCVAYADDAKTALLEVAPELLATHGAVSEETAAALAGAVRKRMDADFGVSVTGIAGPGGGTPEKPVGLVYLGISDADSTSVSPIRLGKDRGLNREGTVQRALDLLRRRLIS